MRRTTPDTPDPDADAPAAAETAPVNPDPDAEDGGEDVDGEAFQHAAE
jgi:ParB family chromosome partitioning protein